MLYRIGPYIGLRARHGLVVGGRYLVIIDEDLKWGVWNAPLHWAWESKSNSLINWSHRKNRHSPIFTSTFHKYIIPKIEFHDTLHYVSYLSIRDDFPLPKSPMTHRDHAQAFTIQSYHVILHPPSYPIGSNILTWIESCHTPQDTGVCIGRYPIALQIRIAMCEECRGDLMRMWTCANPCLAWSQEAEFG